MLSIYLLRHAETDYNAHNMYIGGRSNHIYLSEKGELQAIAVGKFLNKQNLTFDKVFCSTAIRAKRTLELIKQHFVTLENIDYSDDLQELSQGDWEGQLRSKIYTEKQLIEINSNQWLFKAPNGESQKEVEERLLNYIYEKILSSYSNGNFLIVGHGVAFKCLLRGILDISSKMAFKIAIDNASLTKLHYDKQQGWYLDYINR